MADLPTVTVSASAEREVPPDSFRLAANIDVEAPNSAAAGRELVEKYAALETAVADLPDTVTVTHGRIGSWHSGGKRPTWHANRSMSFEGTDTDAVAAVVGAISTVPQAELAGPYWQVDDANPAYGELQGDTVREARARAERYAAALDGTLGALVQLRDPGTGWSRGGAMPVAAMARGGSPGGAPDWSQIDLAPEPQTLTATVEATWYVVLP